MPDPQSTAGPEGEADLPTSGGSSAGRVIVGLALLAIGVVVAVLAYASWSSDDESSADRPVGRLVGSSLPGAAAPTTTAASEGATTTAPAAVPTGTPTTLPDGQLPTGCGGWDRAFSFEPAPIEGVAIYSDFGGWHVRLAPGGPASISGSVSGQVLPVLSANALPAGVEVVEGPDGTSLDFTITAGGEPAGFDFAASCAQKQLTFDLVGPDGTPVAATDVQVGRAGGTAAVPVVAQRTVTPPG